MTYTPDSPAVLRALQTYHGHAMGSSLVLLCGDQMAAVLNEHRTTLQAIIAGQAKTIAELTAERDELLDMVRTLDRDKLAALVADAAGSTGA